MAQATYTVKPGDSLSSIAKEHYGHGDEAHWRKIYDANKDVIGDDPDSLMPKMVNGKEVFPTLVIP